MTRMGIPVERPRRLLWVAVFGLMAAALMSAQSQAIAQDTIEWYAEALPTPEWPTPHATLDLNQLSQDNGGVEIGDCLEIRYTQHFVRKVSISKTYNPPSEIPFIVTTQWGAEQFQHVMVAKPIANQPSPDAVVYSVDATVEDPSVVMPAQINELRKEGLGQYAFVPTLVGVQIPSAWQGKVFLYSTGQYEQYWVRAQFAIGGTPPPPNRPPVAQARARHTVVFINQAVYFSSQDSYDPDGDLLDFHWSFGDGADSADANPLHFYRQAGVYLATLRVHDVNSQTDDDVLEITVLDLDLATDLDGNGKIDDADRPLKDTPGAVIVSNEDDDNRNGVVDMRDYEVSASSAISGSVDENDLKRFVIVLPPDIPLPAGKLVLRRNSNNIRVYTDPRKGDSALLNNEVTFPNDDEGSGIKTWNLPKDRDSLNAVLRSGLFVEGRGGSIGKGFEHLTLEFTPDGDMFPVIRSETRITSVQLRMDYVVSKPDVKAPYEFPGDIFNPAVVVVVIEGAPAFDTVAEFRVDASLCIGRDDDLIEWRIVSEGGDADFYAPPGEKPDSTGYVARVFGKSKGDGRIRIEVRAKAATEPYIVYRPLVAKMKTIEYRCNFLLYGNSVVPEIDAQDIRSYFSVANRFLRQIGLKLVPDQSLDNCVPKTTLAMPVENRKSTVLSVAANGSRKFCADARIEISDGVRSEVGIIKYVDYMRDIIWLQNPVGKTFARGATVTWAVRPEPIKDATGCFVLAGMPHGFTAIKSEESLAYASILNGKEGAVNFSFVNVVAIADLRGSTGISVFSPSNLLIGTGRNFINERDESGVQRGMVVLKVPVSRGGLEAVEQAGIVMPLGHSTGIRRLSNGSTLFGTTLCHEALHGCALQHRASATAPPPLRKTDIGERDGIVANEVLPNIGQPSGHGPGPQNVMWYMGVEERGDLDVIQAIVARASILASRNSGTLQIVPQNPVTGVGVGLTRSDVRFTVSRSGMPVAGARVSFHITGLIPPNPVSVPIKIATSQVTSDSSGVVNLEVSGTGAAGDAAIITAVVDDGQDAASTSIRVVLVEVKNLVLTPKRLFADGPTHRSTAAVEFAPGNAVIQWGFVGDSLGCTISSNQGTASIAAGSRTGVVTVQARNPASGAHVDARLELVRVTGVVCSPPAIAAGGNPMSLARATATPTEGTWSWSLINAPAGCRIFASSGEISAANCGEGGVATVRATDVESGAYADGVVTVVRVGSILLTPDHIAADNTSKCAAKAQVTPAGRTLKWELVPAGGLGCSIEQDGVITAGNQRGTVVVKATDPETGAVAEATLTLE